VSSAAGFIIQIITNHIQLRTQGGKIMDIKDMIEKLEDIKNIGQMLEISLQANGDDPSVIRSVSIINRKLASVIKEAKAGKSEQSGGL